jgi:signal transduction histidine kinase
MSFKTKLLLAFLVMVVPLAVIGAQAWRNVQQETVALRTLEESLSRARIFAEAESVIYRKLRKIRDYLSGWDGNAKRDFEQLDARVQGKLEDWKRATVDPEDRRLARALEELDAEIGAIGRRAFALYEDRRQDQAHRLIREELNGRLLPALDATIRTIYTSSRTHNIQRAFRNVQATERSTTMILIVIVLASALFGVAFSVLVARSLARPVRELQTMIDLVGAGDFARARAVPVRSRDELGELARTFAAMAERLQRAQRELVQSEKLASIGQMSAAVAHGLRNPLASIRAATQLSHHQLPPGSPQREHLQAVIAEVDRLERRISHLLDFTKPVAFAPAAEPVRDLVDRALSVFPERLVRQGVDLRVDVDRALPAAWVDGPQIEQALLEVIGNGLDAMPKGGTLTVSAAAASTNGIPAITVSIQDSGEGIPEAALARVAEPFFTTKADGTGLGLAIARRFVEQNRGVLTFASRENQGTLVTITLPTRPPDAAATDT